MKKSQEEIVRVNCLRHIYPDRTEISICGLEFTIRKGERVAVLGANGSGKTTLLSHIMGLLEPVDGLVQVFGCNPKKQFREVRKRIGVVFQNSEEQIIGPTVIDDVAFAPLNHRFHPIQVKEMVESIMRELDIWHLRDKIPHYLSGGEQKKVAVAGAMVMKPDLLILDEPFTGLDPKSRQDMIKLMNSLNTKHGTSLVITTHDMDIIPQVADQVYILNKGQMVLKGRPEDVLTRVDILSEAGLEPPIMVDLFNQLIAAGLPVEPTISPSHAVQQLVELYQGRRITSTAT